jgi:hypothetical protein
MTQASVMPVDMSNVLISARLKEEFASWNIYHLARLSKYSKVVKFVIHLKTVPVDLTHESRS